MFAFCKDFFRGTIFIYFHGISKCSTRDGLTIYDGRNSTAPTLVTGDHDANGELCGSFIPTPIVSYTNEMYIQFRSGDFVGQNRGYKMMIEETGKIML